MTTVLVSLAVVPVVGQDVASGTMGHPSAAAIAPDAVTWGMAILKKLEQGGITIVFLLGVSVVVVATTLERLVHLRASRIAPRKLADHLAVLCREGRFGEAKVAASASDSTLGRTAAAMLRHPSASEVEMVGAATDVATREMKVQLLRAYPLMVCATISPLLGLFGTVAGMIGAFDKIAAAGSLGDASMLGGDISKALITTAAGLIVAMPALGLYHAFRSRTNLLAVAVEEQVAELLAACREWRASQGACA